MASDPSPVSIGDGERRVASDGSSAAVGQLVEQIRTLQRKHADEKAALIETHKLELEELVKTNLELEEKVAAMQSDAYTKAAFEYSNQIYSDTSLSDEFFEDKGNFIKFVKGVVKDKDTPEYKRLYHILLQCFTNADTNFDGRVGFQEFNTLLETAAFLPRRFGYAPSTAELYATEWDRLKQRMALFASLNPRKCMRRDVNNKEEEFKYISFDQWLLYATEHVKEKAVLLKDIDPRSQMVKSKKDFQEFIISACRSRSSKEYKELYHYALRCFTDTDKSLRGVIDAECFDLLVDRTALAPRLFGFAPPKAQIYSSDEEAKRERHKLFLSLDKDKKGFIDFDTWLEYIYVHICEKTLLFGELGDIPAVSQTGPRSGGGPESSASGSCPYGFR